MLQKVSLLDVEVIIGDSLLCLIVGHGTLLVAHGWQGVLTIDVHLSPEELVQLLVKVFLVFDRLDAAILHLDKTVLLYHETTHRWRLLSG